MVREVMQYQAGQKDAFNTLVEHCRKDLNAIAAAWSDKIPGYDYDDIQQELLCSLQTAATKYEEGSGATFRTFFSRVADLDLLDIRHKLTYDKRAICNVSVSLEAYQEDGEAGRVRGRMTAFGAADDGFPEAEIMADLFLNPDISDVERQVIILKMEGYTNREISEQLGGWVTEKGCYADRVLRRVRKKLQKSLVAG